MDNIKIDVQELEWEGLDWVSLAQDRNKWQVVVSAALNLRVSIKCGEFIDYLGTC
jgi:hypothetical protein